MNALDKRKEAMAFLSQFRRGENDIDLKAMVDAMAEMPPDRARAILPTAKKIAYENIRRHDDELRALSAKIATLKEWEPDFNALRECVMRDLSLEKPTNS